MSAKFIQINNNIIGIMKKIDTFVYDFGNKLF